MHKEEILSPDRLKILIENEIIIAERKHQPFARKVNLGLLQSINAFIDFKKAQIEMLENDILFKDERIKELIDIIKSKNKEIVNLRERKKTIPNTMDIDTLRKDAVIALRTECIGDSEFMELAKQMGADALELKIPKKVEKTSLPLFDDVPFYSGKCPSCKSLQVFTKLPFVKSNISRCNECGQSLDWSDDK